LGGPAENRYTAFDSLCRTAVCREAGVPQVSVNLANLTLYIRVTDLAFGSNADLPVRPGAGQEARVTIDRSYNQDDTWSYGFGPGWSFSLGDSISVDPEGSYLLHRGSGRVDRFTPAAGAAALFAVTGTSDTLTRNADGGYTLQTASGARVFSKDGRLVSAGAVTLDYDSSGKLASAKYRGRTVQFTWGAVGRIGSITDASGRTVSFTYTGEGRLANQTNADGSTVVYSYDAAGNLSGITYGGGQVVVSYTSDPPYNGVASLTTPDGAVRKYDTPHDPAEIRVIDGNGDAALYVSSASGLLQSVTDAAGNTISYNYDSAGNRTRIVNAAGETSSFSYDASGRLTGITDGANNKWSADYSTAGVVRITNPNNNAWTISYDAAGNLISVGDPASGTTAAARNAAGAITALTDANGNKSSYQYSTDGLLTAFTDAIGNKWSWDYDDAARAKTRTDPSGAVLKAEYDARNRISALTAGDTRTVFDYSGVQRDALSRVTAYTDGFGNQLSYTYDGAGQLTSITLPGGKTVSYSYDHLRRLSKVADWTGNFALYRYDAAGWPVSVSESGPVVVYQYDAARNLKAIVSTGPDGNAVAGYRYTYDAAGNRTGVTALEPAGAAPTPGGYVFGFDADNRPVTRGDGQNYKYDARGNLSAIQGSRNVTFSYDALGRLQGVAGDAVGSSSYGPTGLRATRNDRRHVWDVSGARPRMVAELDGGNTPIAWYVYGLGLLWKVTADGTAYFYHFDGDGNVVAMSNAQAGVVNQYSYDAQGRLVSSNEGVENLFHARGESGWIDDGNGLVFTGDSFAFPELRLTLPAVADPAPAAPDLTPRLPGAGACFIEGVANCAFASWRSAR
jgi:YD repeat-containing protein